MLKIKIFGDLEARTKLQIKHFKAKLNKSSDPNILEVLREQTDNMVNGPKPCWNLNNSTFAIFIDHCENI